MAFPQFEVLGTGTEMDIAQAISSARNGIHLAVTDTSAVTGYHRGIFVDWTATADKVAGGEIDGIEVDMTLTSSNATYAYGYVFYAGSSGNPTIGLVAPISIYCEDLGTGTSAFAGIDIGTNFTNIPSGRCTVIRYANGSSTAITSIIKLEGQNNTVAATYFIDEASYLTGPVAAAVTTNDSTWTYKVKCRHGSTAFYLVGCATT